MTPYVYLAAAPKQLSRVSTLTRQEGVRQVLEQPPYTRHDGWNLVTLERAKIIGGRRLTLSNGTRKHITLNEDGTFLAVGTVPNFLAWHRRDIPNKINTLALIEFTYNFLLVYDRVLADVEPLPEQVRFAIGLRHAHEYERPLCVAHGRIDRFDYEADLDTRDAPEDSFDYSLDIPLAEAEPRFNLGGAAYQLLVRLYNWFGFEDEAVPYTNPERTAIEIEQVVAP